MNAEEFIADWIKKNPKGCQTLAGAVFYSYFNDSSDETGERILTLRKAPDADDLNSELIDAIRCTDLIDRIEEVLGGGSDHNW
jgi:hypothetical protein